MSDEKGAPSSGTQTVPIDRLNEVIAQRDSERQERVALQRTVQNLSQMVQQRVAPQRPQEESPALKELKERDPVAYGLIQEQKGEIRQMRAGMIAMHDQQDRRDYLAEGGKLAEKRMAEVEEIVEQERRRGNTSVTRSGVFNWLLGRESLLKGKEAGPAPAQEAAQKATPGEEEAPSTSPRHSTSPAGGTAAGGGGEKTREQRIAELENVEF